MLMQQFQLKLKYQYIVIFGCSTFSIYLFQEIVEYMSTYWITLEVKINVHVFSKSAGIVISGCSGISKTLKDSI